MLVHVPLAVLERRFGPLVLDSLLLTEAIPGAIDLGAYLRQAQAALSPRALYAGLFDGQSAAGIIAQQIRFPRAMLALVIANNILLMFMSWEIVGLTSYFLIDSQNYPRNYFYLVNLRQKLSFYSPPTAR